MEEWSDLIYRSYNNLDMSYHIIYILWNMNQYMNIRIDMRPSTPKDEGSTYDQAIPISIYCERFTVFHVSSRLLHDY